MTIWQYIQQVGSGDEWPSIFVLSGNHPAYTDIRENPGDRDHLAYTPDTTTVSNKWWLN